jgi:hypothetical protein
MKKNRGDDQLGLQYIYTWKYQKETSCVYLYLKQAKMPFFSFLLQNRRTGEQVMPTGVLVPVCVGGGGRKRGEKGEYSAKNVCTCM